MLRVSDVLDYLVDRGIPFLVLPDPAAATADAAARTHRIEIEELVRTEVVTGERGPALMVVAAPSLLDLRLARGALDDPTARPATPEEVRALAPGCDPGAVPPLSQWLGAPMYVDPEVADREQLIFPAARPGVLVCLQREELFRDAPYVVTPLARATSPAPGIAPSHRAILSGEGLVPAHEAEPTPPEGSDEPDPGGGGPASGSRGIDVA
jgi:prolyl-tRNA editing enzyme YbaK/EbsC (Cys-tRNA(Pro) deacylase)